MRTNEQQSEQQQHNLKGETMEQKCTYVGAGLFESGREKRHMHNEKNAEAATSIH